jgi:PIN domain nuclease of toxin-antitoxin system
MIYLLDTHALIWWLEKDENLSLKAHELIDTGVNNTLVSFVTPWEMAIKAGIGKLHDVGPFQKISDKHSLSLLPINLAHIEKVKTLPHHHRDPFDRMLIAQALAEDLTLISNEAIFDAYGVKRVWE